MFFITRRKSPQLVGHYEKDHFLNPKEAEHNNEEVCGSVSFGAGSVEDWQSVV